MNLKARWLFAFTLLALLVAGGAFSSAVVAPVSAGVIVPTPTVLPQNPAEIGWFQLGLNMTQGVGFVLAAFALVGLYLWARKLARGE